MGKEVNKESQQHLEENVHAIDFYEKIPGKAQNAFVIFYAVDGKPYLNYEGVSSELRERAIPTCIMLMRDDGKMGFVGGRVEEGETLEEAAIREVSEEINASGSFDLEPIVAHDIGTMTTHAFAAEVSYDALLEMQKKAIDAQHFGSEIVGVFLPHIIDFEEIYGNWGGIQNIVQGAMAPSVREEFFHFLVKKNILPQSTLEGIAKKAGYSLSKLLG